MQGSDPTSPKTRTAHPRAGLVLAWLVLAGSLLLVASYGKVAVEREQALRQARLVAEAEHAISLLRQQLASYELVVRGGASLYASLREPTPRQFRDYVAGLALAERFPAMVGLGYAAWLTPADLRDLQLRRRASGEGLFRVFPAGQRPHYGVIAMLEPRSIENAAAIGYDMYDEAVRRTAMDAARDEAAVRMSGRVRLVQDVARPQAGGLLLYAPVYRSGLVPASVAARRAQLAGWVYAPLRLQPFVSAATATLPSDIALRIVDEDAGGTPLRTGAERDDRFPGADAPGQQHEVAELVFGRRWRIEFHQAPPAGLLGDMGAARNTIAVGVLTSVLLFLVALALARTQARAERIAVRMSESYRRSELRFRNAMRYSAIGKALLDRGGVIVDANLALADMLRTAPDDLPGRSFPAMLEDGGADIAAEGGLRVESEGVYRAMRQLRRGDGEMRQLQLTFAQVPGEIGQDVAALVQVEDVSDRLRAEAEVLALNRSLEARVESRTRALTLANTELEAFAYSVSHDLRAPLRAIEGFSRMLDERHGEAIGDGRDYLRRVRNATARMGELIDALLRMARASRGELRRERVDLGALAGEILAELQAEAPERRLEADIAPGLQVDADPALLRSLLQNLLDNAWKFTAGRDPARIEVLADPASPQQPAFVVRDNGAGFVQAWADKLFRPFQRLHAQDEFPGHGIGLATVRRIVERHGGTIAAEGVEGEGAEFRFSLPPGDEA